MHIYYVHIRILTYIQNANNAKKTCGGKDVKMLTGTWQKFMF